MGIAGDATNAFLHLTADISCGPFYAVFIHGRSSRLGGEPTARAEVPLTMRDVERFARDAVSPDVQPARDGPFLASSSYAAALAPSKGRLTSAISRLIR